MEYTQNYKLKKPGQEDFYNVDDFNSNADIIDQKLKEIEDKTKNIVTSVNGKTGEVELTAEDIGAETPAGAQEKAASAASAALAAANDYTDQAVGQIATALETHKNENATLDNLGHVKHAVLTATLDTTWEGEEVPYTKTITVNGIQATDTPIIDVVMSGDYATDEQRIEAWGYIYRAVTGTNSITFYATEKPTIDLPIQIKVVR